MKTLRIGQNVTTSNSQACKVNKFIECIANFEGSTSPNPAILMADAKYNLNAACCEDQDAWFEAVALAGHPFSKK